MDISIERVDQISRAAGGPLTVADLPPKNLKRWIARRKAEIVAAVEGGLLSETEACARYNISHEEFSAWLKAYARDGVPGLRARANARGVLKQSRDAIGRRAEWQPVSHAALD